MKKVGFLILGILLIDVYFIYLHVSNIQEKNYQTLNPDSSLVQELYDSVNPSEDATFLKGLYSNDQLSNSYMIGVGIAQYIKTHGVQNPKQISSWDVERAIHSVLGYDISFSHESSMLMSGGICGYRYIEELNVYEDIDGCDGNNREKFYRKIVSAEQTGDWILITEKSIYMYDDWDTNYSKKYVYNHLNREKVLDFIETSSSDQVDISVDQYFDSASTYIYHFRMKNGEYIFEGIRRVVSV